MTSKRCSTSTLTFLTVHIFEEDRKLVRPESGNGVPPAHRATQAICDHPEDLVSRLAAQRVVDRFESLEVDHQDGVDHEGPTASTERVLQPLAEQGPIGKPGQAVVKCLMAELCQQVLISRPLPLQRQMRPRMVEYTMSTAATTKKTSAMTDVSAFPPNPVSLQRRYRPNRAADPRRMDVELRGNLDRRGRVGGGTKTASCVAVPRTASPRSRDSVQH
jgi:hypothetical protein